MTAPLAAPPEARSWCWRRRAAAARAAARLEADEGDEEADAPRAGEEGVPTIFLSGDRAAVDEARCYVPDIEGIVVKEGLSRTAALTLSPAKAQDLIREGARKAIGRVGSIATFTIPSPYTFVTEYQAAASAESRAAREDAERTGTHTIKITGERLSEIAQKR